MRQNDKKEAAEAESSDSCNRHSDTVCGEDTDSPEAMAEEISAIVRGSPEDDQLLSILGPTNSETVLATEELIMWRTGMTIIKSGYGFGAQFDLAFGQALEEIKAALKEEGFGVLTEIDFRKTLKQKLNIEYPNYVVLGVCNPALAYEALLIEPDIGLLLPCNVLVRETDGKSEILALDPTIFANVAGNPALEKIASQAKERLERAIDRLNANRKLSA